MKDNDFIKRFVDSYKIEENRFSCLMIALRDARKLTGRNIADGSFGRNILENDKTFLDPNSFIAVINYLLILEMIGEIFKLENFTTNKKNKIYKALKQFSNLSDDKDIHTIVALRNSLAHNYGLINIPDSTNENLTKRHKFELLNTDCAFLINYPKRIWEGDFTDKSDDSSTQISVIKIVDLVESVYSSLKDGINRNTIILSLTDGLNELKARFTISH